MWGEKHRNFRILESQKCLLFNLWLWDLVNRLCLPGLFSLTPTLNSEKIATLLISFSDVAGRSGKLKAFLLAPPPGPPSYLLSVRLDGKWEFRVCGLQQRKQLPVYVCTVVPPSVPGKGRATAESGAGHPASGQRSSGPVLPPVMKGL